MACKALCKPKNDIGPLAPKLLWWHLVLHHGNAGDGQLAVFQIAFHHNVMAFVPLQRLWVGYRNHGFVAVHEHQRLARIGTFFGAISINFGAALGIRSPSHARFLLCRRPCPPSVPKRAILVTLSSFESPLCLLVSWVELESTARFTGIGTKRFPETDLLLHTIWMQ
jgi:hypothetical protein